MMRDAGQLAVFNSADHALHFAYRHRHGDYPLNCLTRWQEKRGISEEPRLPSGLDAAALAGWVQQEVEGWGGTVGVPEPYRSIMLARFSVEPERNLRAKIEVLDFVLLNALGTGLHNRRMVDLLVQRYFGGTMQCIDGARRPIRQHQIADTCDVSQQTVSRCWRKVSGWLYEKERNAMELLYSKLQGRGLVS